MTSTRYNDFIQKYPETKPLEDVYVMTGSWNCAECSEHLTQVFVNSRKGTWTWECTSGHVTTINMGK